MARKQKIKNRKYEAILMFTATILFSLLLIVLPVQAVEMGEIRSGETKSGNIAIAGQTDSFKFNGVENKAVVIKIVDIDESDFTPEISLYGPDNTQETGTSGSTVAKIENHILKQTGIYTIVVQDWSNNTGKYTLSLMVVDGSGGGNGEKQACPFECCASESGYEIKPCFDGYHCEYPHKCAKNKQECIYECCIDEIDYHNKQCDSGYNCESHRCIKEKEECFYECCINEIDYHNKQCSDKYSCVSHKCVEDKADTNKRIKNDELSCEGSQVIFQGKCVEISSLLKKDEERISKEEYKSIIEKFDVLKKEDREKLEKLAAYLEGEIQIYLDKHEYESAKIYTSLSEITYYQLKDENKVYETKKKYEEIKKEHFIYKLTHPFNDPLEVFSTIIFEFLIYFICVFKKIRDENGKFSFKLMMKHKYWLIAGFIAVFVVLWAMVSTIFTMLK